MSSNSPIGAMEFAAPPVVPRWRRRALLVGAVFGIATIVGFIIEPAQAMHSYLLAFMFCLGLCLGSMGLLMVWHLTGGDWGVMIRRILEAAMSTLPMMAAAFIPVVVSAYLHMYPWANPEELAHSERLQHQAHLYLSPNLFLLRGIVYFVAWGFLVYYLLYWSRAQDEPPERAFGVRFRAISGAGIIVYAWTLTFAVIDWVMSLTPEFTSSIYGFIFLVGQALIALCLAVIVARMLQDHTPMSEVLEPRYFHDYGNLMLTFVMLWAYFNFSQWLIIWSGNLSEEIHWFQDRIHGGWDLVSGALIFGHFVIPFTILLFRAIKRDSGSLVWLAAWLILMRYLDLYWNVEPNFHRHNLHYSWLDAVIPIAMFALWLNYFLWNLGRRPLVALYDPHLAKALAKHE